MKKVVLILLVLSLLFCHFAVIAEDMGVQVIGGPNTETEPVSLDDVKLDVEVEIDGYGAIKPITFFIDDWFYVIDEKEFRSGQEADYILLYLDILNTTTKEMDYRANADVKVIFDDVYEYGGWSYQIDYDYNNGNYWTDNNHPNYSGKQNQLYGLSPSKAFAIKPMYKGHYVFGCTLPNAILESKKPLRMVITIDGNEITYNIRK